MKRLLFFPSSVLHPVQCDGCHRDSFMGFRYKCQRCYNYQLCQDCFWRGRTSGGHSNEHQMKEYTSYVSYAITSTGLAVDAGNCFIFYVSFIVEEIDRKTNQAISQEIIALHSRQAGQFDPEVPGSAGEATEPLAYSVRELILCIVLHNLCLLAFRLMDACVIFFADPLPQCLCTMVIIPSCSPLTYLLSIAGLPGFCTSHAFCLSASLLMLFSA